MAQLKPTQWARKEDLQKLASATERALQEMYEALTEVQKVATLEQQVGVIAVGLVNLNTAVLEIQQALFEEPEEGPEPDWDEGNTKEVWDSDRLASYAEEDAEADARHDEQSDLMLHVPEEDTATGEGMPEPEPAESRKERIARMRREAREPDPVAAFEAANASTTEEMAAADTDFNSIGGLPEEGILISPGEVTPGLTDLGGGNE